DLEMTYQYSNFGVPGLGLRRGLGEDVVVAPYATGLAAMVDPGAAIRNFRRLAEAGARGTYGFYEALDYTGARIPEGESMVVVRAYMAHHQGMLLLAIANALHDGVVRAWFHADPSVRATELLLQERTPRDVAVARPRADEVAAAADARELVPPPTRRFTSPHSATPRTHLLSNGRYAVMLTAAGSGYSRWRDLALTRCREIDVTSYAEVVLAEQAADVAHPAFSNLFVQTECAPELDLLLATRRPRAPEERALWLAHVVVVEGETLGALQWETDRARFLGR